MIKRSRNTATHKKRDHTTVASAQLVEFLEKSFKKQIPLAYVTGVSKKYGTQRSIKEDDKFISRFVENRGFVSTRKLTDYLRQNTAFERGRGLTDDAVKRVYENCANNQGKMTFDYLMKMGSEVGVPISEKEAKDIIRKYGNRKNFLSVDDCIRLNERKLKKSPSPSPHSKSSKKPK